MIGSSAYLAGVERGAFGLRSNAGALEREKIQ